MIKFMKFLNKGTSLIAAVVGIVQIIVNAINEALTTLVRVCAIVFFWTDIDEKVIVWLSKTTKGIDDVLSTIKEVFLLLFKKEI